MTQRITHENLTEVFGRSCGHIISEQAPFRIGLGTCYLNDAGDTDGVIVNTIILPRAEHRSPDRLPSDYFKYEVTEKAELDVWDHVWIQVKARDSKGPWISCGNRCGGVQEYAKVVAPHLAFVAVREAAEATKAAA